MKNIKRKLVAAIVATTVMYGTALPAFAEPLTDTQKQEINVAKDKYEEIQDKIIQINTEIAENSEQISEIMANLEENEANITAVQLEIDIKAEEIKENEEELLVKENEYGDRLRQMYKQGNSGMIQAILGSESITDLVSRTNALIKIAKIDKELLDEIEAMKVQLEEQKVVLDKSMEELSALKAKNQLDLNKMEEKQALADQLLIDHKEEENKILSDLVMAEKYFIGDNDTIINDSNSSDESIRAAVESLKSIRSQIITNTTEEKVVSLINKGRGILSERAEARAAAEAARRRAEAAAAQQSTPGATNTSTSTSRPAASKPATSKPSASGSAIVNYAYKFLGTPYKWGGSSPSGFDCSGFTSHVYRNFGVSLPRTSRAQSSVGTNVSYNNLQAGDLVFFGHGSVSHVGIYIGGGTMVHSPRPGKSVEVTSMRYHNFIRGRRVY